MVAHAQRCDRWPHQVTCMITSLPSSLPTFPTSLQVLAIQIRASIGFAAIAAWCMPDTVQSGPRAAGARSGRHFRSGPRAAGPCCRAGKAVAVRRGSPSPHPSSPSSSPNADRPQPHLPPQPSLCWPSETAGCSQQQRSLILAPAPSTPVPVPHTLHAPHILTHPSTGLRLAATRSHAP